MRPALRFIIPTGLTLLLLGMTACSKPDDGVSHRGLSPDGYGFVQNGPVLAPPDHLMQHPAAVTPPSPPQR